MERKEAIEILKELELHGISIVTQTHRYRWPEIIEAFRFVLKDMENLERIEGSGLIPKKRLNLTNEEMEKEKYPSFTEYINYGFNLCRSETILRLKKNWPIVEEVRTVIEKGTFKEYNHRTETEMLNFDKIKEVSNVTELAQSLLQYFNEKMRQEKL